MIDKMRCGLGHVPTVAGRTDAADLAGECHDQSRAARHADRAGEAEAEEPDRGELILVRDQGEVESVSPETGKTNWKGVFPKSRANFYASPLVAGDKLYAAREDGAVFVASIAGGRFETLSETEMGEPVIGSPVPFGNRILIRGENHLYCFGE